MGKSKWNRIECRLEHIEMASDRGPLPVPGVKLTCPICGRTAEAFGRSERSVNFALRRLKVDTCDHAGQFDYYVAVEPAEAAPVPPPPEPMADVPF